MKTYQKRTGRTATLFLLLNLLFLAAQSQITYTSSAMQLIINGTSTLHDWDMKSSQGSCQAVFTFNSSGQISGISSLVFTMPVANLKSGKSSMDNNAYKALKKDVNPSITYTMNSATVFPAEGGATVVKSLGTLSIAGKPVTTDVFATCKVNADKSIAVTGTKRLNMLDFNMVPPTFMMGSIKTGNLLTLTFNGLLKK